MSPLENPSKVGTNAPLVAAKPATQATSPAQHDQRSYLAMMALAVFMLPTGLARAYRGDGWARFWVYVGATVFSIIPFIGLIGSLAILVLVIMGLVDVFKLRNATTDASGIPLAVTPTDKKWGHGFFVYLMVSSALVVLIFLAAISLFLTVFDGTPPDFMRYNSNPSRLEQYVEPSNY